MITSLLLSVSFCVASLIAIKQKRRADILQERIARISATDDELVAVLEATDTPLAKKLLEAMKPQPPQFAPAVEDSEARIYMLEGLDFDTGKLEMVRKWASSGIRFSPAQIARIVDAFDFDSGKVRAMALLETVRGETR